LNCGIGEIDPGDARAPPSEPHEIHTRAAPDFEHIFAAQAVKGHEPEQMMELIEVVFVQVSEERR
jgi:hypothetical protein